MNEQPTATDDYFKEIEAQFAFRRGTAFVFSGKDWALMKSWHESGIPLAIVLEAIDTAFDSRERTGRKGVISSLSYCRHAVTELWEERRQQLVGSEGGVPELSPVARVAELAGTLRELAGEHEAAVSSVIEDAVVRLDELASKERSAPSTEDGLIAIETALVDGLLDAIPAGERDEMIESIEQELSRYAIANEETREKTRDANLRRLIRQKLRIPRLSLFG